MIQYLINKAAMKNSSHAKSVKSLVKKLIIPSVGLLVLSSFDLGLDIRQKDQFEIVAEFLSYGLLIYIAYIGFAFYKLDKRALEDASKDIHATHHKLANIEHKNKLLQDGISQSMHSAFQQWKLTPAESEVASLIVKGYSLSEIANFRGTSIRTSRDQAAAIYHKAKLKNRIELTAYFVEDLL